MNKITSYTTTPKPQKSEPNLTKKCKIPTSAKSAAVTIKDVSCSYEQIMILLRARIDPSSFGITEMTLKRSIGGGLVLQIPGLNNKDKAERLAAAIRAVLNEHSNSINVRCPEKTKEVLIRGLDGGDGITIDVHDGIFDAIMNINEKSIVIDNIKKSSGRLGAVWIKSPTLVAEKLLNLRRLTLLVPNEN